MASNAERADEELMRAYRDGDAGAFDELYRRHKGRLFRYFLRQCRDAAAASELFQDTWMNLIRARAIYEPSAKFTTYLYRLAHNRLIDHYRKSARSVPTLSIDAEQIDGAADAPQDRPELRYERKERAMRLLALIDGLPPAQREAFVLQQEGGMSVEEIAAATGVPRETAKSRLRYAVARLRAGMSEWR